MPNLKAMPDAVPDPKLGSKRRISGMFCPYYTLDQSIEVAKVIHEKAGGSCDRAQLATLLNYNGVKNGAFLTRVTAAKIFGLISQHGDQLTVTDSAHKILHPVTPSQGERAKVDAFLTVGLFRKAFDEFNGINLPDEVGLKNLFLTKYQIVEERTGPSVRVMLDSAEQAGLFRAAGNRSKMVMPLTAASPVIAAARDAAPSGLNGERSEEHGVLRRGGSGGGGSSGGGEDDNIDPAILGLLRRLPPGGTALSAKRRKEFIDAIVAAVAYIYPDADTGSE